MSSAHAHALKGVDRYFYLRCHGLAAADEELADIFRLRFAIYCQECGFLPTDRFPDGMERDEYDPRSVHFSAVNESSEVVGTSRLVVCPGDSDVPPLMALCPPDSDFDCPPAHQSAEVSRLAVNKRYRRRQGDTLFGVNEEEITKKPGERDADSGERRSNAPLLVLGLYREMYQYSRANDIRYWYAAMEPSLVRVLRFFGFDFELIGPQHDYYGPVSPYLGDLDVLEEKLEASNPDLLAWFKSSL